MAAETIVGRDGGQGIPQLGQDGSQQVHSSSLLMLPARMFANAVMEALSSQAFTALTSRPSYARPFPELTTFAPGVILFS